MAPSLKVDKFIIKFHLLKYFVIIIIYNWNELNRLKVEHKNNTIKNKTNNIIHKFQSWKFSDNKVDSHEALTCLHTSH
jgi:hypothetical protein